MFKQFLTAEFEEWVTEVKATAKPITEEKFNKLLKTDHVGRETFTGTHLEFCPAPEGENAGHFTKISFKVKQNLLLKKNIIHGH